jgi:hypothetical protein
LPLRSQSRSNVPPSLGFVPKAVSKMLGRETLRPVFSTDNSPPLPSAMAASSGLRVSSAASLTWFQGKLCQRSRNAHACSNCRYTSNASEWVEDTVHRLSRLLRDRPARAPWRGSVASAKKPEDG